MLEVAKGETGKTDTTKDKAEFVDAAGATSAIGAAKGIAGESSVTAAKTASVTTGTTKDMSQKTPTVSIVTPVRASAKPVIQDLIDKTKTDREVILLAISGDRDALGRLYAGFRDFIAYYCKKLCYSAQMAEDAESEVALRMVMRIHSLEDPDKFTGWLYSICRLTCMDINRKEVSGRKAGHNIDDVEVLDEDLNVSPEWVVLQKELQGKVLDAIDLLPKRQRELVEAFYIEQLDYQGIQKRYNISSGSVAKSLDRARKNLKKLFAEKGLSSTSASASGFAGYLVSRVDTDIALGTTTAIAGSTVATTTVAKAALGAAAVVAATAAGVVSYNMFWAQTDVSVTEGTYFESIAADSFEASQDLLAKEGFAIVFDDESISDSVGVSSGASDNVGVSDSADVSSGAGDGASSSSDSVSASGDNATGVRDSADSEEQNNLGASGAVNGVVSASAASGDSSSGAYSEEQNAALNAAQGKVSEQTREQAREQTRSGVIPWRYMPEKAKLLAPESIAVGYSILEYGTDKVLLHNEGTEDVIDISSLELGRGEYTIVWKANTESGKLVVLERSFVIW